MGKLVLKIGQMNPPASWEEKYQLPKGELPEEWAKYVVAEFNRALKPGEPTRYLMGGLPTTTEPRLFSTKTATSRAWT